MKVESNENYIAIIDLSPGDTFKSQGSYYLVLESDQRGPSAVGAIKAASLETGNISHFGPNISVERCKLKAVPE